MITDFIANAPSNNGGGLLDWIIIVGFSLSTGGAMIYRLLAARNGWWSDDK